MKEQFSKVIKMRNQTDEEVLETSAAEEKMIVSIYLPFDTIDSMEDVLYYGRKTLPRSKRSKLTKSTLYEIVLKKFIADYEIRGKESVMWDVIVAWGQTLDD